MLPAPPLEGKPVLFPPGRVEVRLNDEHRRAYRNLYAHYATFTDRLPVLRDRDFDGRPVKMTRQQLEALNRAFARLAEAARPGGSPFSAQEAARTDLFKRLQYLS